MIAVIFEALPRPEHRQRYLDLISNDESRKTFKVRSQILAGIRPQRRVAKPERPEKRPASTRRVFADPFAADDSGTNCIRCGYLVSPAREKRAWFKKCHSR